MKNTKGILAVIAVVGLGCTQAPTHSSSSGSLALSKDDALLYAADTDNGTLSVIDAKSRTLLNTVKVGDAPFRVAVASDDTIFVANRGSLDISVIRRGDWKEASRITLGAEPVGMQVGPDDKSLFVVTSTTTDKAEVGSLMQIDTASLTVKATVTVGNEPRGLAVVGNRAIISLFKVGEMVEVDTRSMTVAVDGTQQRPLYNMANATKLNGSTSTTPSVPASTFRFRGLSDVVATPDGTRLFVPTVLAREDAIGRLPASGGYYGGGGPCNVGAVASAGVLTLAVHGDASPTQTALEPKVDDVTKCVSSGSSDSTSDWPTTTIAPKAPFTGAPAVAPAIQGPTVAAVDPTGSWLFVVSRESSNVSVMPTDRRDGADLNFANTGNSVRTSVAIGNDVNSSGADGIAITKDGTVAFVYSQFDHRVDIITTGNNGQDKGPDSTLQKSSSPIILPADTLSADIRTGRKLFFDAVDIRLSAPGTNVSCATCHLEGTNDQHTWGFPDGVRQTPSLAGRHLKETAPYHWSGEFPDLRAFMNHTVTERMGGNGLGENTLYDYVGNYIESLPTPFNPYKNTVTAQQVISGAQAFSKAGCDTCHSSLLAHADQPQTFTDGLNHDVGTQVMGGPDKDNGIVTDPAATGGGVMGFNVPSLFGVARSGPLLHSGTESNLEARVNDNNLAHGNTAVLSAQEKIDLVAYLKTL